MDGWTEFTADHLSARRSTTDLTWTRRSRRLRHHPPCSHCIHRRHVMRHFIYLHTLARLRIASIIPARCTLRACYISGVGSRGQLAALNFETGARIV